jgi:hypothetical protein
MTGNLVHPDLVTAAFKGRGHKYLNHLFRILEGNKPGGKTKDVGVVVLSGQGGDLVAPADGGPYSFVFIGGDAYAVCRPSEQDAEGDVPLLYRQRNGMGEIRIIRRIAGSGAKIKVLKSLSL